MPAPRHLGSTPDSLALVARLLTHASQPGEAALAGALAAEARTLLRLPVAAIVDVEAVAGHADVPVRGVAAGALSVLAGASEPLRCAVAIPLPDRALVLAARRRVAGEETLALARAFAGAAAAAFARPAARAAARRAAAIAELRRHAGTQFDPAVVDALLGVLAPV